MTLLNLFAKTLKCSLEIGESLFNLYSFPMRIKETLEFQMHFRIEKQLSNFPRGVIIYLEAESKEVTEQKYEYDGDQNHG